MYFLWGNSVCTKTGHRTVGLKGIEILSSNSLFYSKELDTKSTESKDRSTSSMEKYAVEQSQ